jgi:hypothetical protein
MFTVEGAAVESFRNNASIRQTKEKPEEAPKKASEL